MDSVDTDRQDHLPIEEMDLFLRFEEVSDRVWEIVLEWNPVAIDTVGKQLVRASDSVGANLVEGDGRYSMPDSLNFFTIARASARETRLWIRRAIRRKLITLDKGEALISSLESSTRQLNRPVRYRRSAKERFKVRENISAYSVTTDDPFTCDLNG